MLSLLLIMASAPKVDTEKHPNVSLFEVDDAFIEQAEKIIQSSGNTVSAELKAKYEEENTKNWDAFYTKNQGSFFKDRHYIPADFALDELLSDPSKCFHVVDMGCGAGNALLPMLHQFPDNEIEAFE